MNNTMLNNTSDKIPPPPPPTLNLGAAWVVIEKGCEVVDLAVNDGPAVVLGVVPRDFGQRYAAADAARCRHCAAGRGCCCPLTGASHEPFSISKPPNHKLFGVLRMRMCVVLAVGRES